MLSDRPLPNHADLQPYNFAVAGHDGTLCDPDGELFIKPCTQQEIDFYQAAVGSHQAFADLMPVYMGTLQLNDVTDMDSVNEQLPGVADHMSQHMKEEALRLAKVAAAEAAASGASTPQENDGIRWRPNKNRKIATNKSVVLENTTFGFTRPNILDAKLGKRLWADDAPLEKRKRFDEISKATTNGSHGFRIAGMRVYKGSEDQKELDQEGYKVYGKDYGRLTVTPDNIVTEMRRFIFNPEAGIDEELGRTIAAAFLDELRKVERVLASEESRMYSASLLFTFEGDGKALRSKLEQRLPSSAGSEGNGERAVQNAAVSKPNASEIPGLSASRVDSAIALDDDGEIILRPVENGALNGASDDELKAIFSQIEEGAEALEGGFSGHFNTELIEVEEEMELDEDDEVTAPKIVSLKLIDFAHASWVPGQGPDENNLMGVRSLVKIFEELSAEE